MDKIELFLKCLEATKEKNVGSAMKFWIEDARLLFNVLYGLDNAAYANAT